MGAFVGLIGGIIDQAVSGDWSVKGFVKTGISVLEGAATAVVGPAAGALISGFAGGIGSALSGNDTEQVFVDAFISAGISLVGSGGQLAAGRALAGDFVNKASKTQLKTFANSLGYVGRNFKTASSWSGKIMYDAAVQFSDEIVPQVIGQSVSFIGSRLCNAFSFH